MTSGIIKVSAIVISLCLDYSGYHKSRIQLFFIISNTLLYLNKQANQMLSWRTGPYLKGFLSIIKRSFISCVQSKLSLISFPYQKKFALLSNQSATTFCAVFCNLTELILLLLRKLCIQVLLMTKPAST